MDHHWIIQWTNEENEDITLEFTGTVTQCLAELQDMELGGRQDVCAVSRTFQPTQASHTLYPNT